MRAIEPLAGLAPPPSLGPVPELRWLPIAELVVDESYQRPIAGNSVAHIKRIARGFDWRKFAPVIVSPVAGGRYSVVDGQHRATSAASIGLESVPCLVIQADAVQQAQAFAAVNGQALKINRLQLYHAQLAAGEAGTLAIDRAAREAGVTIIKSCVSGVDLKPGHTMAAATIGQCLDKFGASASLGLAQIRVSEGETSALLAQIILAVSEVLSDHQEWRGSRLEKAFADMDLLDMLERAKADAARRRGVKTVELLEAAIVTHLDSALSKRAVA